MSEITSANIDDLGAFVTGSESRVGVLSESLTTSSSKANLVIQACAGGNGFQVPSTPSLAALGELLSAWSTNAAFVSVVRNALVEADQYAADGTASVADADIAAALTEIGLTESPDPVEVAAVEMYGMPPYSGFVDDPICLATGNFVHGDEDLDLPGFASDLAVVRMYNSRAAGRVGVFGAGWSSLGDVALDHIDRSVEFVSPDGGGTRFERRGDGSFEPDLRRNLRVVESADGWSVFEGHEREWSFDAAGTLTALRRPAGVVRIERDDETIHFVDDATGRWVRYELDAELHRVVAVRSSDDRVVTYDYVDGRLVTAHRAFGDVSYEWDGDLVSAVIDADGVVLCRNDYDADGRVRSQVEAHGRTTEYEYRTDGVATVTASDDGPRNVMVHDRRGRLTTMIDGLGNAMRVAYDASDNVVRRVDRTGAATTYEHDERGNLVRRVDPDGRSHSWTWDDLDRTIAETDRAGNTTRFRYTGDLRSPSTIVQADGSEIETSYDDRGLPVAITDPDGVTSRYEWDEDGQLVATVDGLGGRTEISYDARGRSVGARNPAGVAASLGLDRAGRVRTMRTADGEETFEYTAAGRMVGGSLIGGNRWRAAFDPAGEVVEVSDRTGERITFERDTIGQVTGSVTADGARHQYVHDPVGRTVQTVGPQGERSGFAYDAEGRLIECTDALGAVRRRTLDAMGRTETDVAPGGAETRWGRHPNGELASIVDEEGNEWRWDIDAMGRVVRAIDPLGGITEYGYTPAGRLAETRSPLGRVQRRSYDGAGRLATIVEPGGDVVRFDRRADGTVIGVVGGPGSTTFDIDDAGRHRGVTGPWGAVENTWDEGRVDTVTRPGDAPATFDHDPRGLLVRTVDPAGVATDMVHDLVGRPTSHRTAGATTTFDYDASGNLRSTTDPHDRTTTLSHDPRGALERVVLADGTVHSYRYDADGRLSAVVGADDVPATEFVRDRRGIVIEARADGATSAVQRDAIGRIVEVTTDAGAVTYEWDADGRLVSQDAGGVAASYTRDERGDVVRLDADGSDLPVPPARSVERDRAGRVTVDDLGRRFDYDVAGRLSAATVAGATTQWHYDDRGLLAREVLPDGTDRRYTHGPAGEVTTIVDRDGATDFEHDAVGRRVAQRGPDGRSTTYRWDALGRLTGLVRTTADGTEVEHRIAYDPFGRPLDVDGIPILWDTGLTGSLLSVGERRLVWSGDQVHEIGTDGWSLHTPDDPWGDDGGTGVRVGYRGGLALDEFVFFGARVYDTSTRSFLSRDPLPPVPGAVAFSSAYAYAWNDPVNFVDPSGCRPISDEEYAAFREQAAKGTFEKAYDAMADDPWGTLAMIGVTAVGVALVATGVGTAVGVGILIGVGVSAGVGLATGTFNPRSVAINGVIGGATAGFGGNLTVAQNVAIGMGEGFVGNVAEQTIVQGRGFGEIDLGSAFLDAGTGGLTAGAVSRFTQGVPGRPDGQTVVSGHGGYSPSSGTFTVPAGTSVTTYAPHGASITDRLGNAIETGAEGRIGFRETFGPGADMPNYTVYPPHGLDIAGNPTLVKGPTQLDTLLSEGMGDCHLATCLAEPGHPLAGTTYDVVN